MSLAGKPLSAYRLRQREVPWGPARGPWTSRPSLTEFVLLSMLLHALAIALFGAPAGGSREGRAMWGSLNVVLQGLAPEPPPMLKLDRGGLGPTQPNIPMVRRAYAPPKAEPSPQLKTEPAIPNVAAPSIETPLAEPPPIIAPPVEVKPVAIPPLLERLPPQERNFELPPTFEVPPPTEIQAPAPVPTPPPPAPKKPPKVAPPVAAPPPPQVIEAPPQAVPAQAPLPAPRIERVVVPPVDTPLLQPIERPVLREPADVPPITVPPIPVQAAPPMPAPVVPSTPPVQAPPVEMKQVPAPAPPVEVKPLPAPPIENIVPRVETTAQPVEKAPAQEVPVTPPPAAAPAVSAPTPRVEPARIEPPARTEPGPRETAPPRGEPSAPKEQALPRPSTSPFGNPSFPNDTGKRLGDDKPSSDYDPFASPKGVDLDSIRRRAAQLGREGTGQRALLPFPLPPVPPKKSKMEEAIENARKPDCKTAYQQLGLAAVVPLVANEFGEGNCRW